MEDVRERAIALHARRLAFRHPVTREAICVVAPVSPAWGEVGMGET
jgi:23S rRNA-/tRNA-specific pseudouridylate synthase